MGQAQTEFPAFGSADLTNCEREQIHLAGSIQPHGALLVVREEDGVIVQASANAVPFLKLSEPPQGLHLCKLGGDLWEKARDHIDGKVDAIPVAMRCHLVDRKKPFNALLHHASKGGFVVELERAGRPLELSRSITDAVEAILGATSLKQLCDETAKTLGDLTGYDRVMVYRFDDAGHGEVYSESKQLDLEPFLGNRYPATDIPQIARRLYERNRVRLLADINYAPSPLEPRLSPLSGEELDMSLCFLRSVSPIHVQYLKNMGVVATLVVSLMVGGRLWGLIACHHYSPRTMHFEMRAVCELLAEVIGTRIAALENFSRAQGELSVRRLEQQMIESISQKGDWRGALLDREDSLLQPLGATGAALLYEGRISTVGDVPGTEQIRELAEWLEDKVADNLFVTAALAAEAAIFAPLAGVASGVVAARISDECGEMLIWFRKERVRTVTWGGNPFKPSSPGDDPLELSPRRSFAQWRQVVEGTSEPWIAADLAAARLIGASVTDVALQFRCVRILIARDQLEQVRRQVQCADHQVVITDAEGCVLQTNAAVGGVLDVKDEFLRHLDELIPHFVEREEAARRLRALLLEKRSWRGEVRLRRRGAADRPVFVRADPVFASPERVLGYVILFTDLSCRKAADLAKRQFQNAIFQHQQSLQGRMDSEADAIYRQLMSNVIENAQLAALEIGDGIDGAKMPEMLQSVDTSVARAAEVLEQLSAFISRARRSPNKGRDAT